MSHRFHVFESPWTQSLLEPTGDGVDLLEINPERIGGNLLNTIGYAAADHG